MIVDQLAAAGEDIGRLLKHTRDFLLLAESHLTRGYLRHGAGAGDVALASGMCGVSA
jgi:hypothetical protein